LQDLCARTSPRETKRQCAELAALADAFGPVAELVELVSPVVAPALLALPPAAMPLLDVPLLEVLPPGVVPVSLRWQPVRAAATRRAKALAGSRVVFMSILLVGEHEARQCACPRARRPRVAQRCRWGWGQRR
jgi:hypothetical protein